MYNTKNSQDSVKIQEQGLIKSAQVSDVAAIVAIQRASWRHAYPKQLIKQLLSNLPEAVHQHMWSERVSSAVLQTIVCFERESGKVCGFAMFEIQQSSCEVHALYLPPQAIGKGYGRDLLEHIMQQARQSYCGELRLWVMEDNSHAIGFYQHLGMQLCGVSQVQQHFGQDYRKSLMTCDLFSIPVQ